MFKVITKPNWYMIKTLGSILGILLIGLFFSACDEKPANKTSPKQPISGKTGLDIDDYQGDKLLLCSGNPDKIEMKKYYGSFGIDENNKDWYTVDIAPIMRPDYLADLLKPETYKYLEKKKFGIIYDEYCITEVSHELRKHAASLLKSGGILVSKLCGNFADLDRIKEEMKRSGFREIIFGKPNENIGPQDQYRLKYFKNEVIIQLFKDSEYHSPSTAECALEFGKPIAKNNHWYEFVAIRK